MPAKLLDRFTANLVDCLTTKHVDHLTAKLVVVNLVKLHVTKLKMYVNTVTLKTLTSHSDAESITSSFLLTLLKLYSVM